MTRPRAVVFFRQSHGEKAKLFFLCLGFRPRSSRFCRSPLAWAFEFFVTQRKIRKLKLCKLMCKRLLADYQITGSSIIPDEFMNVFALMAPNVK